MRQISLPTNTIVGADIYTADWKYPLSMSTTVKTITSIVDGSGTYGAGTIVITSATHGYTTGKYVVISGTSKGYNTPTDSLDYVTAIDANTFWISRTYTEDDNQGYSTVASTSILISNMESTSGAGCLLNLCITATNTAGATITATIKAGSGGAFQGTVYTAAMTPTGTTRSILLLPTPLFLPTSINYLTTLEIILRSNNSSDTNKNIQCRLFDTASGLDISTINLATPLSASSILANPTYPIVTNPDGSVKTKNGLAR